MKKHAVISILLVAATLLGACRTVGISREKGGYAEVEVTVAHEMLLDNPTVVVLDVRPTAEYDEAHIAGALSTPYESIELRLPELAGYQTGTLIVYGDKGVASVNAAKLLAASGFKNVVRIDGGIREWTEKGYRTVSSPPSMRSR